MTSLLNVKCCPEGDRFVLLTYFRPTGIHPDYGVPHREMKFVLKKEDIKKILDFVNTDESGAKDK